MSEIAHLVEDKWGSFSLGGQQRTSFIALLSEFSAHRDEISASRAALAGRCCTPRGAARFNDAAKRSTKQLFEDVVDVIRQTQAKLTSTSMLNKDEHEKVRFVAYKFFAAKYLYEVPDVDVTQRIPLPYLPELLIKSTFPGGGPLTWTHFKELADYADEKVEKDFRDRLSTMSISESSSTVLVNSELPKAMKSILENTGSFASVFSSNDDRDYAFSIEPSFEARRHGDWVPFKRISIPKSKVGVFVNQGILAHARAAAAEPGGTIDEFSRALFRAMKKAASSPLIHGSTFALHSMCIMGDNLCIQLRKSSGTVVVANSDDAVTTLSNVSEGSRRWLRIWLFLTGWVRKHLSDILMRSIQRLDIKDGSLLFYAALACVNNPDKKTIITLEDAFSSTTEKILSVWDDFDLPLCCKLLESLDVYEVIGSDGGGAEPLMSASGGGGAHHAPASLSRGGSGKIKWALAPFLRHAKVDVSQWSPELKNFCALAESPEDHHHHPAAVSILSILHEAVANHQAIIWDVNLYPAIDEKMFADLWAAINDVDERISNAEAHSLDEATVLKERKSKADNVALLYDESLASELNEDATLGRLLQERLRTKDAVTNRTIAWDQLEPDLNHAALPGGMGVVYRAKWFVTNSRCSARSAVPITVAVKVLKGGDLNLEEFERAIRELEEEAVKLVTASADNQNQYVVKLYGVARGQPTEEWHVRLGTLKSTMLGHNGDRDLVGLVMRWEPHGTLALWLRHDQVTPRAARTSERLRILEKIAEGISRLHTSTPCIIHGDIKSDNVLFGLHGSDEPRLADFGLAKLKTLTTMTVTQRAVEKNRGTWPYMAPEMFRRKKLPAVEPSRSTDVFAFGTLAWETLTGMIPWRDYDSVERLLALTQDEDDLDWSLIPIDVPRDVRDMLKAAVSLNPRDRPTSKELCASLKAARERLDMGVFDLFLSHAWAGDQPHSLTQLVHRELRDNAGAHVWYDVSEMGLNMPHGMTEGVEKSDLFVALISRRYCVRTSCMHELREARRCKKTVIPVLMDPDVTWIPLPTSDIELEREVASLIDFRTTLYVDLRPAAADDSVTNWLSDDLSDSARALVTNANALPRLADIVKKEMPRSSGSALTNATPHSETKRVAAWEKNRMTIANGSESDWHCIRSFKEHGAGIWDLCEMPDGRVCTCSSDGTIRVWDVQSSEHFVLTDDECREHYGVDALNDTQIVACSVEKMIRVW
jgi:serine/threonine protein kinase